MYESVIYPFLTLLKASKVWSETKKTKFYQEHRTMLLYDWKLGCKTMFIPA